MASPPPSGAEHIEGAVHFEVLHGTASTEVTPAPEGLGAGATNPMQPKTSNSKLGKYSLLSKYCRSQFKFRPSSFPPVGRLKHCLVNWQLICKDPWVLQAIEGYHIDFTCFPNQKRHPHGITHTQAESNLIENEVQDLLTK